MPLTGRILSENGRDNVECYSAGLNGDLPLGVLATHPIGKINGLYWALPCSTNGVTVTGFDFQQAVGAYATTKPRIDAVKVIIIEDTSHGGSWKAAIVTDAYTISDYISAACSGCSALPDVTVIKPLIFVEEECVKAPVDPAACSFEGSTTLLPLSGGGDSYTAQGYCIDADGNSVAMSPATVTGASVTALAAAAQSAWGSEMGNGTFTANGQTIVIKSDNCKKFALNVIHSSGIDWS